MTLLGRVGAEIDRQALRHTYDRSLPILACLAQSDRSAVNMTGYQATPL